MKKLISLMMILALLAAAVSFAEEAPVVTVTVANGTPVLIAEPVAVTDTDGDGVLTVQDALHLAHEAAFDGGAAAGFCSANGDWGLMLTKLWGVENGGSYGYYVNHAAAMSLADPVQDGDVIDAFVYTDVAAFSDTYCWFTAAETDAGLALTLTASGFDANWVPVTMPVAGAVITFDGTATEFVTDAEGTVTVTLPSDAPVVIGAVSESMTLVPPVYVANAEAEAQLAA